MRSPPASSPPTCCRRSSPSGADATDLVSSARSCGRWSTTTTATGRIGMSPGVAEALTAFRRFNYEHIYLRPASQQQASAVVALLRALVEHYADRPHAIPAQTVAAALGEQAKGQLDAGSTEALAGSGRLRRWDDRPVRVPGRPGAAVVGSRQAAPGDRRQCVPRYMALMPRPMMNRPPRPYNRYTLSLTNGLPR